MSTPPSLRRTEARLREETRAEVRFDAGYRGLYSTDASLYQIIPLGVAIPRVIDDVAAIVRIAAEERVALVPRGAATSLSGQTVGDALVIDFSKYLNRIGIVDRDRSTVRVEPGVVLDQLNTHVAPLGLMFAPDVSTSDRATIGGMVGNNSAGARSLRYGKTVDHVRSLDVVLDDGSPARFQALDREELDRTCRRDDRLGRLHQLVRDEADAHAAAIRERFPRILRRVSGYNLDEFVPGLAVRPQGWPDEPWRFNLSRLIVGSEGTLAVLEGAELRLVPKPAAEGLVVLSYSSIPVALGSVAWILETGPVAVEMLDRVILDLAAAQPDLAQHIEFATEGAQAVLAAQFHADSLEHLQEMTSRLAKLANERLGVIGTRICLNKNERDSFWKVRKAGLSLLMGMVGDAKPVAFVEDTAVALEKLPAFHERFLAIVARHGANASCYGHADVGCLHIRPILDLKQHGGVGQMRAIAREVAELVAEFQGAMSGEHGDGLARSLWNHKLFGDEVYGVFQRIKTAFDPENRLNPGKVVGESPVDHALRIGPDYRAEEPAETAQDFARQGGFARAVELCSGVGVCRKTDSGTMCPSYMATREEEHTTRGRANALRLVLTGELPDSFGNETLHEALDLCLQCKACKTECPSNVDLAKLKAETLYQRYKLEPAPLGSLAMAYIDRLFTLGSCTPFLSNAIARNRLVKWLLEKTAGVDRRRTLPALATLTLRAWFRRHRPGPVAGTRGQVILLDDCFTNFNAPHIGMAAVRVLEAMGYRVDLSGVRCCGRPAISKGMLARAKRIAAENVGRLAPFARQGVPILGCEPSCLLTFVDEYRDFRLGSAADDVARASHLVETWIGTNSEVANLGLKEQDRHVLLHGHCQQKALVGTAGTEAALRQIPGLQVRVLDSGCCGMAGSFGYELGHYDVSVALARRVLLPACRENPDATLVAPGFSCRSQVHDLEQIEARHPIELLADALTT